MIQLEKITKKYRENVPILKKISVSVSEGEMVFVTGHSGAGKTTLLRLMGLVEKPSEGHIFINGQNVTNINPRSLPFLRRNYGLIFQDSKLLNDRNVFDNVALPLRISGFRRSEIPSRVRAALDKVGLLKKEQSMPVTLSGGEQQRLCIARAIINRPAILLADEPTANLDVAYEREIIEILKDFNQVGVTVVVATHNTAMVESMQARQISLKNGELN
ncbi:MAG: cell division ATP-binding protein FtsE [Proteobacteria bacterium]|nr:cell division ATP-binding protein FtsE [Pseudomonadota bacterium]